MAAPKVATTVDELVEMYSSGKDVPIDSLDKLEFHDALAVRRDMAAYKKRK